MIELNGGGWWAAWTDPPRSRQLAGCDGVVSLHRTHSNPPAYSCCRKEGSKKKSGDRLCY